MRFLALIVLASIFVTSSAYAKRFANKYAEFELPSGWECELEGSEWVCQSTNADRKKEAIIILAAKIRGEQDDLDKYQQYLKQTKIYVLPGGKKQVSESKYVKMKTINAQRWVDALHLASEVPGFYTRYLATVKEDLGVAVTFSVSKEHYAAYQTIFDKIIASLRVFRQKHVDLSRLRAKGKEEDLLEGVTYIPDDVNANDLSRRKKKAGAGSAGGDNMTLFIILGGAIAGFIIMKKKKKKK